MNRIEVRLCVERFPGHINKNTHKDVESARRAAAEIVELSRLHGTYPHLNLWIERRTVTDWVAVPLGEQELFEGVQ